MRQMSRFTIPVEKGNAMKTTSIMILLFLICIVWPFSTLLAKENTTISTSLLLAQSIKMNLAAITGSVKVLGDTYVHLYDQTPVMDKQDQQQWTDRSLSDNQTVLFRPLATGPEPGFQAPQPSYYYYHGKKLTANVWREFNVFTKLVPMFQITYDTFNDSWVYLTTKDGAFLIYPYMPLDEAVHAYPPTKQIFYTAADFKNRASGWTPPYLDLAGAGMMVTVAYPIYRQEELLGVISRDITLTRLANQVLKPFISYDKQLICLIIDKNGMAIASSQDEGMKEIITVNTKAKAAVLYYCERKMLPKSTNARAQSSSKALYNKAGQLTLAVANSAPQDTIWHFTLKAEKQQYQGSATRIDTTGWFVIDLRP